MRRRVGLTEIESTLRNVKRFQFGSHVMRMVSLVTGYLLELVNLAKFLSDFFFYPQESKFRNDNYQNLNIQPETIQISTRFEWLHFDAHFICKEIPSIPGTVFVYFFYAQVLSCKASYGRPAGVSGSRNHLQLQSIIESNDGCKGVRRKEIWTAQARDCTC